MMPRVVLAPDKFKTVISAPAACEAMASGVARARADAEIVRMPMADGGEGTLECLLGALGGQRRTVEAQGPLGDPVTVPVGLIDRAETAVVELSLAAGYALVPPERRNPRVTSTYGLGQVLRTVIETGVSEIILAIGGSATVDGGAGMMQALGLALLDERGKALPARAGGGALQHIARIAWENPPEGLEQARIRVACDVLNPACGPHGAARVFGPQKGADPAMVEELDRGLARWARVLAEAGGRPVQDEPGTGAAGGVAMPLLALLDASIEPGVDLVIETNGLTDQVQNADLVFTGEGCLDGQSLMGKVVGAVARLARSAEVPCVALVGKVGAGAEEARAWIDRVVTLDAPLERTEARLAELAEAMAGEYC